MQAPLLQSPPLELMIPSCSSHASLHFTDSEREAIQRKLKRAIILSLLLMALEIGGGILAHSLAIVTDAAHLLSDVSGFAVSLFAVALSQKRPSLTYTYGYHQAEILGAIVSVMIVWAMTGVLLFEAFRRFADLQPIDGQMMLVMSVIGLLVNLGLFGTLHHHHDDHCHHGHGSNLALDSAVVHVIGDMIQSIGVIMAAVVIVWNPIDIGRTANGVSYWNYADPLCTVLFSVLVMATTYRTVKQSVSVLMHRVPENVNVSELGVRLREISGVECVHDIHVWLVGSSNAIGTAHVVIDDCDKCTDVLKECKRVASDMGIGHSTFQVEVAGKYDHAEESFGDIHSRDEDCCNGHTSPKRTASV